MKETSYSLGVLVGKNLASQVDLEGLDYDKLAKGVVDALGGGEMEMSEEDANFKAQVYLQESAAKLAAKSAEQAAVFLTSNGEREEVTVLPSGLQYEVLTEGTGTIPKAHNKVIAHYEGTLVSGKIFDSSYQRGEPATFPVGGLIKGWQEALQLMPVGSKWRLVIPSHLGYGERGAGNDIPGGATLIFDLELLQIV